MRAIEIREPGGPEVLTLTTRERPVPAGTELLVKVLAAGINRPDCLQRQGAYPPPPGASDIPGLEIAGEVIEVGSGVSRFQPGARVCALVPGGGYAEYCCVDETNALPAPGSLTMTEAAAIPETFFTVWHNVFQRGALKPGGDLPGSWRHVGHRHHGNSARQGVRRESAGNGRHRGEMRGDAGTGCGCRDKLSRA